MNTDLEARAETVSQEAARITSRQQLELDIDTLLETQSPHCLSIYHDAAAHGGDFARQQIALKNLIKEAKNALPDDEKHAVESREIGDRLNKQLPKLAKSAQSCQGLCILSTQRETKIYALPFLVPSKVIAGPRFFLSPLVSALSLPYRYFVLALSQHQARLVLVDDQVGQEVPFAADVPTSLDEATPTEIRDQLQFHTSGNAVAYHGQRPSERRKDEDIKRYLSRVAEEVKRLIGNKSGPLVLAGVPELTSKFRELTELPMATGEIHGNPDELTVAQLSEQARAFAEPELNRAADEARQKAERLSKTDQVVDEIPDVLRAAHEGRVETLILRQNGVIWGNYDEQERTPHFSASPDNGSVDLLNLAALQSYRHGAEVYLVAEEDMPVSPRPAVAILRYAS